MLAAPALVLVAACGGDSPATPTPAPTTQVETIEVSLFFAKDDATGHVEITRRIPASEDRVSDVVKALLAGPTAQEAAEHGVTGVIPEGTRLLSADIEGGVATVDLSNEVLNYGGGSAVVLAITGSLELSLTALADVESVVILVDGQPDALQP
ncbi:MAG TPA: GerMN domain-containing protein [Tepidiformaceae bacterium]|nr:GerMN domain-containing protein [Tepidiformaceae bacterium]